MEGVRIFLLWHSTGQGTPESPKHRFEGAHVHVGPGSRGKRENSHRELQTHRSLRKARLYHSLTSDMVPEMLLGMWKGLLVLREPHKCPVPCPVSN